MKWLFEEHSSNSLFTIRKNDYDFKGDGILKSTTINTIAYNLNEAQTVIIDEVGYTFPKNTVLPLMANQHFIFERPEDIIAWQFNRDFYCIVNHDAEVGCVGFLFYGIDIPLFLHLTSFEMQNIISIEKMCLEDMQIKDRMQGEMLRTLLKRLIINTTRIARTQTPAYHDLPDDKMDMVRKFNLLIEGNFRTEHEVQFYASALNKSPKTLSNIFLLFKLPPPSKLIQNRIVLEAKRYLQYTDKTAKEITYMLGFGSPAHFSRFFKQHTGVSITQFRETGLIKP